MDQVAQKVLRFDRFVLDLDRGCLRAGEQDIELRPKAFQLLTYLAVNAGRLVSKQELLDAVWPNVVVSDESLVQIIWQLRKKLGDEGQRIIKTVPKRGYLLDVPIRFADAKAVTSEQQLGPRDERPAAPPAPAVSQVAVRVSEPERRHLTIMVCDLVGLSALAARLDPEDLHEVIVPITDASGRLWSASAALSPSTWRKAFSPISVIRMPTKMTRNAR
jgi:DNA-binding winged helix-turn-helix (wHTH) protein